MNIEAEVRRLQHQVYCDVCGQVYMPKGECAFIIKTWSLRADIMCAQCWGEMMLAYEKYILGSDSPIRPAAS